MKKATSKKRPLPRDGSAQDELALGVRLKHARIARAMRLADLAAASGCSESLISKIENRKATPSLNTLHRLAKGLGITIATLLSEQAPAHGIIMREGQRPVLSRIGLGGFGVDGLETELLIPFGADFVLCRPPCFVFSRAHAATGCASMKATKSATSSPARSL